MDNMNHSHISHIYNPQRAGVVRETIPDMIKRLLRIGHPYRAERKAEPTTGCWAPGWCYAYVPNTRHKDRWLA